MRAVSTWGTEGLAMRRFYTATGSVYNRHYLWDLRGNIAAVTDDSGALLSTPASDGFSSSGTDEPVATFGGQVGGYRDAETGLILFQNRYYDSNTGTWLTRDPIGEAGGINLYGYVTNNPVNRLAPTGLVEVESLGASIKQAFIRSVKDPKGALDDLKELRQYVRDNGSNGKQLSRVDKAINKMTWIANSGFRHQFSPRYWKEVRNLPKDVQKALEKQVKLLEKDPSHNSLNLEQLGGFANRWSCRINDHYRIIGEKVDSGFIWRQITAHDYRRGTIFR